MLTNHINKISQSDKNSNQSNKNSNQSDKNSNQSDKNSNQSYKNSNQSNNSLNLFLFHFMLVMARQNNRGKRSTLERSLVFATEPDSVYGIIVKEMGSCAFLVDCSDSVRRHCFLRGKLQKKVWVGISDIVLVVVKEDNNKQGFVDMKYSQEEIKVLKQHGVLKGMLTEEKSVDVDFENI